MNKIFEILFFVMCITCTITGGIQLYYGDPEGHYSIVKALVYMLMSDYFERQGQK